MSNDRDMTPKEDVGFKISGPDIFGIMTIWSSDIVVSKLNLTQESQKPMSSWPFEELSDKQIQALAEAHARLFENRVQAGQNGTRGINIEECQRYLQIWNSILAKTRGPDCKGKLTAEEKIEIRDALLDGGYDDLLEATTN